MKTNYGFNKIRNKYFLLFDQMVKIKEFFKKADLNPFVSILPNDSFNWEWIINSNLGTIRNLYILPNSYFYSDIYSTINSFINFETYYPIFPNIVCDEIQNHINYSQQTKIWNNYFIELYDQLKNLPLSSIDAKKIYYGGENVNLILYHKIEKNKYWKLTISDYISLLNQIKKSKEDEIIEIIDSKFNQNIFRDELQKYINTNNFIKSNINQLTIIDNVNLIKCIHNRNFIPEFLRTEYSFLIDAENKIIEIQFEFPDYTQVDISCGYKGKSNLEYKYLSSTDKKKFIKKCLFSLIIRIGHIAAICNTSYLYENIVINVEQKWNDKSTGLQKNGFIASLQSNVDYLKSLDLTKLDPEYCFRNLKGIIAPSLEFVSPIRPIYTLDKNDPRIIATEDISSKIDNNENLAAMDWDDFEHLVAQLFEWEFSSKGIEVKVTVASRDKGVDAILYDPDPIKGGKYVLQAKRYTRTVDVSSVRDLYGTVMNEGANRGILITTAHYGPDAYEFAKDKAISLIDGPNLLNLFRKHGKNYKIDLEEARKQGKVDY